MSRVRVSAYRLRLSVSRWFQTGLLPSLLPTKQVTYEAFTASDHELDTFVLRQGQHPTKMVALDWLATDPLLPETLTLWDIGCGPGVMAKLIAQDPRLNKRIHYTGIDQSESALTYCRATYGPGCTFLKCDLQQEELPAGTPDVILVSEVIEHLPDYRRLFDSIFLKKPTVIIVATFGVIPGLKHERKLWNKRDQCYMHSYPFDSVYQFLRSKTSSLRIADLGSQTLDRFWFPTKTHLLFYLRLTEREHIWGEHGWTQRDTDAQASQHAGVVHS